MAELHSITGTFSQESLKISYGGYFFKGKDRQVFIRGEDKQVKEIKGLLADCYGISKITGAMGLEFLNFKKQYEDNAQVFDYTFTLKNGIWVGKFKSPISDYNGTAMCRIKLIPEDCDMRLEILK